MLSIDVPKRLIVFYINSPFSLNELPFLFERFANTAPRESEI